MSYSDADSRQNERDQMLNTQIIGRGISDERVIAAIRRVPRHHFIPGQVSEESYGDYPLPIGHEQTISQPYIVAFMTEVLQLQPKEKVLEIGTGSGYQAAVLAELDVEVFTIEIIKPLARNARDNLASLGYDQVRVREGDGYKGWPEESPFDAIIVTAAPGHIPSPLLEQLAIGGRLIIPVGEGSQNLVLVQRDLKGYRSRDLLPVRFVPMTGEGQEGASES